MTELGIYVLSKDVLMMQSDCQNRFCTHTSTQLSHCCVPKRPQCLLLLLEARTGKKEEFHPVKMNALYPKLHWLITAVNISVLVSLISLDT
jgi:hypothetical protein